MLQQWQKTNTMAGRIWNLGKCLVSRWNSSDRDFVKGPSQGSLLLWQWSSTSRPWASWETRSDLKLCVWGPGSWAAFGGGVGSDTKKHGTAALASCLKTCWKSLSTLQWRFTLYKFKICITHKFVPICSILLLVKFYLKDNCWTCHIDTIWSQHYDVINTLFWITKVCRWSGPRPRYFGVYRRAAECSPNKARQLRESHVQVWHFLWEWKPLIFMCPLG